jgi:hypothetical protein
MKQTFFLYLTLLCVCSCNSNSETISEDIKHELIGDWSGKELYWQQGDKKGEGGMDWDYRITKDSIYIIDYPTQFKSKNKITFLADSLKFNNGYFESTYSWKILDSLLVLCGNSYYNDSIGKDSMVFERITYDNKTILDIKTFGFNPNIIEIGDWKFDKENTVNYRWKNFDTTIFNPPKYLSFKNIEEYYLSPNCIKTDKDTFSINYLSKDHGVDYYWLDVQKLINDDTINLSYNIVNY